MMRKRQFGELELAVLKVVKEREWVTVREVLDALGKGDSYTTVMTVMNRLVEKKELVRTKEGRRFLYQAVEGNKPMLGLLERLKQKVFGGKSLAMINYLIESSEDIDDEDLDQIQKLIEEKLDEH